MCKLSQAEKNRIAINVWNKTSSYEELAKAIGITLTAAKLRIYRMTKRGIFPPKPKKKRIIEMFYDFATKQPNGCWEWTRGKRGSGYGAVEVVPGRGSIAANRASWILTHGSIPDGMQVLHTCDNRPCVNPDHLFLGTNYDNVQDKVSKGRQWKPIGRKNHAAKLTEADVREIRRLYKTGKYGSDDLAKMFGVSKSSANKAATGFTWGHVK